MFTQMRSPLFAAAIVSLIAPIPLVSAAPVPGVVYTVILPAGEFGSQAFTAAMVGSFAAAKKFCAEIGDTAYRVDCLAERFGVIAGTVPRDSDYADLQKVLKTTSDRLAALARANRDPNLPRGRATRPGAKPETTTRPLTPVAPAASAKVNQQAQAILQETQTLLLRSAESSKSKQVQYARIADAIGSNKVLLRAA